MPLLVIADEPNAPLYPVLNWTENLRHISIAIPFLPAFAKRFDLVANVANSTGSAIGSSPTETGTAHDDYRGAAAVSLTRL